MAELKRPFPDPSILLHPQIPKPLHLLNPRTLLGVAWWDEQRQIAYARHGFRCWACGVEKYVAKYHPWLEAHELYDIDYTTGSVTFVEVVALCHSCHNFIHRGRMERILGTAEMPQSKYDDIIAVGNRLLQRAGLTYKEPISLCAWEDWHLVINGVNYGQRFHSYAEWSEYWSRR